MTNKMKREFKDAEEIYQVRLRPGGGAEDFLDHLTWTVWKLIAATRGRECLKADRWPDLRGVIQRGLASRLVRYAPCEKPAICPGGVKKVFSPSAGDQKPPPGILLLEVKDGIDRLIRGMSAAVERRFAGPLGLALRERRAWRIELDRQLEAVFADCLYSSPYCADCPVRADFRERRLWVKHW